MKTTIIALTAILSGSISTFAQSKDLSHSALLNKEGKAVEIVSTETKSTRPVMKNTFTYAKNGNRESKTLYLWDGKKNGWKKKSITEYYYNAERLLASVSFSLWNDKNNTWDEKKAGMVYLYDKEGNFFAMQHTKTEYVYYSSKQAHLNRQK